MLAICLNGRRQWFVRDAPRRLERRIELERLIEQREVIRGAGEITSREAASTAAGSGKKRRSAATERKPGGYDC